MNTLGDRLSYARKKNGYTQDSLASAIGVSRGVIFNLEKNKSRAQIIVINSICKELKINKTWLIDGTGDMEDKGNVSQSSQILEELNEIAKNMSVKELRILLAAAKAFNQPDEE